MKAFILAAGRGERLRPLSLHTPKPLLPLAGEPLIVHHIKRLASAGITDIVINVSYLADHITKALGNGKTWQVKLTYSYEPTALESGGGIVQALPLLGTTPFLVISADIFTDYPFEQGLLPFKEKQIAHLVLSTHPACHRDFHLKNGWLYNEGHPKYTYGNIGYYHPDLFAGRTPSVFPLSQLLRPAVHAKKITGELYAGCWENITSVAQYDALKQRYG